MSTQLHDVTAVNAYLRIAHPQLPLIAAPAHCNFSRLLLYLSVLARSRLEDDPRSGNVSWESLVDVQKLPQSFLRQYLAHLELNSLHTFRECTRKTVGTVRSF